MRTFPQQGPNGALILAVNSVKRRGGVEWGLGGVRGGVGWVRCGVVWGGYEPPWTPSETGTGGERVRPTGKERPRKSSSHFLTPWKPLQPRSPRALEMQPTLQRLLPQSQHCLRFLAFPCSLGPHLTTRAAHYSLTSRCAFQNKPGGGKSVRT